MPEESPNFATLMQRIRAGSDEAARELYERYGPHILRVVRRNLNQRLRSRFDSIDFVQEVWTSFFADGPPEVPFDRPQELVAFLTNMAQHKVVDAFRQQVKMRKRDLSREQSLERTPDHEGGGIPARQPTPSQVAVANEHFDQLVQRTEPQYRAILDLLRQGNTHEEIARQLGLNERTVRRVIRRIDPEHPEL